MKGLSLKAFDAIERMIKNRFDSISMQFLGMVPTKLKSKQITFSTSPETSMISLFLKALGSQSPNAIEEQTLKTMLRVSNGYLDALRDRTAAKIMHEIESQITNASLKNQKSSTKKIDGIINKEMGRAGTHLKLIVNSESNKAANTGTALQISKLSAEKGEDDPTVFFIVVKDEVTGPEEWILHLLPDRKTPRLWKLSEIGAEYHKVGDPNPKLPGLHPNCRCKLTYLAKGWGFSSEGKVKFISLEHDEFKRQRELYGKPR
jgi:hypothetical protein